MSSRSAPSARGRRARVDPEQASARILDAFSAKAKHAGIRALIMTELATELRMSATTLYRLFPSKEALALACVERWADELGAAEAAKRDPGTKRGGYEQFMHWVEAWADANASISPTFTQDLKTDYPAAWRRYREIVDTRKQRGAALLRPLLKPGVDERVAFALLNTIFTTVLAPEFSNRLRLSRHEALRTAVSIWAGGALTQKAKPTKLQRPKSGKAPRTR